MKVKNNDRKFNDRFRCNDDSRGSAPAPASAEDSPSYTLTVLTEKPSKGENVEVLIKGHQLKDVYAYEINLDFNPKQLKLKEATTEIPGFSVSPL